MFQSVELDFIKEFLLGHYSTEFYLSEYAFPRQAVLFEPDDYLLSPFLACFVATYDAKTILKGVKAIYGRQFTLTLDDMAQHSRLQEIFNTKVLPYCNLEVIEQYIEKTLGALKAHCEGAPDKLNLFNIIQSLEKLLQNLNKLFPALSNEKRSDWQKRFSNICDSLAGGQVAEDEASDSISTDNWFPLYILARHDAKRSARAGRHSIGCTRFNPKAHVSKEKSTRTKNF